MYQHTSMEVEITLLSCAFWYDSTKASRIEENYIALSPCSSFSNVSIQEFLNMKANRYYILIARYSFSAFNKYAIKS